ncbi:MAG: alpha/beta hydrolase [Saprospiraceae bacterium]
MNIKHIFLSFSLIIFFIINNKINAQVSDSIFLYETKVSKVENNEPCIFPHLIHTDKPAAAVVIFPGGGYRVLSMDYEGHKIAKWFNDRGINAIVVKYRLGILDGSGNLQPAMLNDAIRAMQMVRKNAKEWNIDPDKIGVIGFSAGGHMASSISVHFEDDFDGREDFDPNISAQPNFSILAYPVITMNDEYSHWGSRRHSLGTNPTKEEMDFYSSNLQVKPNTPPTFIFHTSDDKSVPVQNSILYYLAVKKMGIPVEMHIMEHGPHGVGLAESDPTLNNWNVLLERWLINWGFANINKE